VEAFQRAAQPSVRAASSIGAPVRVGGVSPHGDGGGLLQPVLGSLAPRGSPRGGPARPAIHGRPPPSDDPRRPHPQPGDTRRGHESRPAGRDDGVGPVGSAPCPRRPSRLAGRAKRVGPSPTTACTTDGCSASAGRPTVEAPVTGGTGGTATPRSLLQLQ
jgi:hypothetical protein